MTIRYKCEECGAALNINDELAGTQGNCPRCQVQFTVPAAGSDPAADLDTAPQPAVAVRQRSANLLREGQLGGGPLSDDDISAFLSSDSIPTAASDRRVSVADSDDDAQTEEEQQVDEERRRGRKKQPVAADDDAEDSDAEDPDAEDPGEEADDNESEKRSRKQNTKRAASPAVKSDSNESASIARNLMGRGAQPVERAETAKKKRRPFGGREERREGELTSVKDVVTYFAKRGWPFVAAGGAFLGLLIWFTASMYKHFEATSPLAPVTGTVTIDGKPVNGAIVKFVPAEATKNFKLGTSIGITDANGKYALTYASDDGSPVMGAVIGLHQVQIQLNDPNGAQLIPPRYSTYQSELKADVAKGIKPIDFPLKSDLVEAPE